MSTNPAPDHDAAPHPVDQDPPTADAPAVAPERRRRLVLSLVAVAAVVLAVDQVTKQWALAALDEGVRQPVLGDLLGLQLLFNPGAALGLSTGTTWPLTLVAVAVTVVIVRVSRRLGSGLWALALGLLLGGALGNLGDRLFRQPGFGRGHVVDFIAYLDWFVGNVADIAIVVAAGLLMVLSLRGVRLDGTRDTGDEGDGAAGDGAAAESGAGPADEDPAPEAAAAPDQTAPAAGRERADG